MKHMVYVFTCYVLNNNNKKNSPCLLNIGNLFIYLFIHLYSVFPYVIWIYQIQNNYKIELYAKEGENKSEARKKTIIEN